VLFSPRRNERGWIVVEGKVEVELVMMALTSLAILMAQPRRMTEIK
jgi:hypothetical protein